MACGAAEVASCYLGRTYPFKSDGGGTVYWTRCRFRYAVQGTQHESTTTTTSTRSQAMVERMTNWMNAHRKGTSMTVHYDPADPNRISLAGDDEEIQTHTARTKLQATQVLAGAGLASLLLAFMVRGRRSSGSASV